LTDWIYVRLRCQVVKVPTYERLDRILISTKWEQQYPLATVEALSREISNHTPLLLSLGEKARAKKSAPFKFELGWLLKEFFYVVSEVWRKESRGTTSMQRWQNKIRILR
jgi:hypothetical protein